MSKSKETNIVGLKRAIGVTDEKISEILGVNFNSYKNGTAKINITPAMINKVLVYFRSKDLQNQILKLKN